VISLKSPREIEIMRRANVIVAEVLQELKQRVVAGVTTLELDAVAEVMTLKKNAIPAFKGYNVGGRVYPLCLCASVNDEIVHGIPSNRALREGDIYQFGQFLLQSHASSRDHFKNSTPELDNLVEIAQKLPGCYGARLTGGGFGGATINLVQIDSAEEFKRRLAEEYYKHTNVRTEPWTAEIVDGAS